MSLAHTVSAALGDYDLDGDLDLALAQFKPSGQNGTSTESLTVWRNESENGVVRFNQVATQRGWSDLSIQSTSKPDEIGDISPGLRTSFADINADGRLDVVLESDFSGKKAIENRGDDSFTPMTAPNSVAGDLGKAVSLLDDHRGIGCSADFNSDGFLDVFLSGGMQIDGDAALLFSDGAEGFENVTAQSGLARPTGSHRVVCDDFNLDGRVDLMFVTDDSDQRIQLWINQLVDGNTLSVSLEGTDGNTAAIGAKIILTVGGRSQTRTLSAKAQTGVQNSTTVYFGLAEASTADRIEVVWPNGQSQIIANVAANQRLVIQQSN